MILNKKVVSLALCGVAFLSSCKNETEETRTYSDYAIYKFDNLYEMYSKNDSKYGVYFYFEECKYCKGIMSDIFNYLDKEEKTPFYLFDIKRKSTPEGTAYRDSFKDKLSDDRNAMIEEMKNTSSSVQDTYFFGTPSLYIIENGILTDCLVGDDEVKNSLKTL